MNMRSRDYLEELSQVQRQAVECVEGPLLIIAGAGSGKTKVLTHRIAYLLQKGVQPENILALTFTNKAANEMKARISQIVESDKAYRLRMGTFHSIFARILRSEAGLLGWPTQFTIYDKSDSKSALRACIKELQLDDKQYPVNEVQARISMAKNNLLTASAYLSDLSVTAEDAARFKPRIADIYRLYAQKCRQSGVMDFDDLLLYTNVLFRDFPQVLEKYQSWITHILVDEYQDTNFAQYLIVKKLAQHHRNLCVVGDDAQSIYAFRGARIENILNFTKDFPEAASYRLEQNYRSTQTIVNAANSVIKNNLEQLKKECFSQAPIGEKIDQIKAYTDHDEANMVVGSLVNRHSVSRASYDDFAILYRTNAQSRVFEESLRKRNIPYKIWGGFSFYERAEVKDMLAYLRLIVNPKDDEALKRIINVPARGIGETTLQRAQIAAIANGTSLWELITLADLEPFGIKPATQQKLRSFTSLLSEFSLRQWDSDAYNFAMEVAERTGYLTELKSDLSLEGRVRMENMDEFFNSIKSYSQTEEELSTIHTFLSNVALITEVEQTDNQTEPRVNLMTMHAAKGLEFKYVYIVGLEENLFPSALSCFSQRELEEERRLFYVAMTRAKTALTLSWAQSRYRWGTLTHNPTSRFLKEVDPFCMGTSVLNKEKPKPLQRMNPIPFPVVSPFTGASPTQYREGQRVEHDRFGVGQILSIEGNSTSDQKAVIAFDQCGTKTILLKFAKIKIL
ncbi:MAG: UvrD-helicase domain-containing protein [Prevotellaceae bacterium]|jgi:DNA helicase-2/ATP-dependent DNA helicase PcrA|nr:UvrD-helicase domain-containing protein [Prevotellaceae bacterium]